MIKLKFGLKSTTKTCYRFENKENGQLLTIYLKKDMVDKDGINPENGVIVSIEGDVKQ